MLEKFVEYQGNDLTRRRRGARTILYSEFHQTREIVGVEHDRRETRSKHSVEKF